MKKILTLIITTSLVLAACGQRAPRKDLSNLPSLIQIISLDFRQNEVRLRVSHRNRATRMDNQLSCQLAIKDQQAIQINSMTLPDLTTYATETITTQLPLSSLNMDHDDGNELPYVLDCFLFSSNFRKEQVITRASLYPVPGNNGTYR
ncbi:hypothetical protein ACFODZ_09960 [Marinicella sediminis]|uniref:Lipoprotein n=1 Tax=Marinicella sediminis TaxID=1792834 RepID=A0ABV7JCI3_9GAMM|nr:hypothetical protein [Marinicella sediminis]